MKSFLPKRPKKCFDDCEMDSFKVKKLPDNFAETVLNLELDVEQTEVPLEAVNQLIELYACAVEYYESIHSDRFLIFQNKMRNLLLRPNVMQAMEKSSPQLKKYEAQSPELQKMQKLKDHEMNVMMVKQQLDTQKVKSILKDETKKLEDISSLLKHESAKQQDDIMKRLMSRKNKKLTQTKNEQMIENIVNIVKRKESVFGGRRTSRSFDTNVLEREYYGTEDKSSPSVGQESPNSFQMTDQRKKSIAMLKRASKDLTAIVEKRMSKLNVFEIEQAVQMNRVNSIKKHMLKNVVEEEGKNDDTHSSESDESESISNIKSNQDTNLQSPIQNQKNREINLLKFSKEAEENKEKSKRSSEGNSVISLKNLEESKKSQNDVVEKKNSGDNIVKKNKTSADEEIINNSNDTSDHHEKEQNQEILKKEIESKIDKKQEEYLKEKEEIKKKYHEKINLLETQINGSGGQSKLLQKMLDQVKKEQTNENEKLNIKYDIKEPNENIKKEEVIKKNDLEIKIEPLKNEPIKNEPIKNEPIKNESIKNESIKNEQPEKIQEEEKLEAPVDAKIKKLEKEKDDKIKAVLGKFGNQINQLEAQLKQNKSGGGLIAKLLEKLKKEELNQMEAINKEYDEKMLLKF